MTALLIVGLGSIGRRHGRNFRALGVSDIVGVDPDPARRDQFTAEVGGTGLGDLEAALARGPTLAVIASPNRFHVSQALTCARAGCHLLIEKPLGTSLDGVAELAAEIAARELFAHVGSNWKFHPAFLALRDAIAAGAIGHVTGVQVLAGQWLPDWHPWEDYRNMYAARADLGGGIILDAHELDYLTWMLGPVAELNGVCRLSGRLEVSTEDVAAAWLRFESGVLGSLHVDYLQRVYRRRWHVSGDAGTLEWDMADGRVHLFRPDAPPEILSDPVPDLNAMYVDQARHVLAGIRGETAPVTPVAHARGVLALQLAWRENRAP